MQFSAGTFAGDLSEGILYHFQNYFFKFTIDSILRADFKTRMEGYAQAIQNGVYTPNECREKEDMPSVEGADKLVMNGNYIPVDMAGQQYVNQSPKGGE
jgi:phage portal protein BeeE